MKEFIEQGYILLQDAINEAPVSWLKKSMRLLQTGKSPSVRNILKKLPDLSEFLASDPIRNIINTYKSSENSIRESSTNRVKSV